MNIDLVNHIAATIRRVDGDHTMGAGALAEAIVDNLRTEALLPFALYMSFSDTELEALKVLIEGASFGLANTGLAMRLHKAAETALADR